MHRLLLFDDVFHGLGAAKLTKRESEIDRLRLATVVAATDVTVAGNQSRLRVFRCSASFLTMCCVTVHLLTITVITREKLQDFQQSVTEHVRETVNLTMGATTTKNLATLPFLQVCSLLLGVGRWAILEMLLVTCFLHRLIVIGDALVLCRPPLTLWSIACDRV